MSLHALIGLRIGVVLDQYVLNNQTGIETEAKPVV